MKTDVVALIRSAILAGRLAPGQRLREDELAAEFGVSRTPIREALRILAAEGCVESTPYAGSRVRAFEVDEVDAAFQGRAKLEGLVARRAAQRITPLQLRQLAASATRFEELGIVDEDNITAVIEENEVFHRILSDASGSTVLADAIRKLAELPLVYQVGVGLASGREKLVADHTHRQIVKAVATGDANWACNLAEAHVLELRDHTVPYVERQQVQEAA